MATCIHLSLGLKVDPPSLRWGLCSIRGCAWKGLWSTWLNAGHAATDFLLNPTMYREAPARRTQCLTLCRRRRRLALPEDISRQHRHKIQTDTVTKLWGKHSYTKQFQWWYGYICVCGWVVKVSWREVSMLTWYNIINVWVVKGLSARCSWRFLLDRTDTGFGG